MKIWIAQCCPHGDMWGEEIFSTKGKAEQYIAEISKRKTIWKNFGIIFEYEVDSAKEIQSYEEVEH